jgi:hypothetical protein
MAASLLARIVDNALELEVGVTILGFELLVGFLSDGCGCNFASVGSLTSDLNKIRCGWGFIFHLQYPKLEKTVIISVQQPSPTILHLISHTIIRI